MTSGPAVATTPARPSGRPAFPWLPFGMILAAGLLLRVREARLTPLWFDEIFSLWTTRTSFGVMLETLSHDIHPPLLSTLLWVWRLVGGENPMALKILPILIGLATVAALFFAARDWFGEPIGLLAAALLAIHPVHVYFSQELRSYGLLILMVLLVAWTAWRWVERGRVSDGLAYALCAALALYTHYLSGLVLMMVGLWGFARLHRHPRRSMAWALWQGAALLLFLPQAPMFLRQLMISTDHWMPRPVFEDLANLSRKITYGARYMVPVMGALALLPLFRSRSRAPAVLAWWTMVAAPLAAFVLTRQDVAHLFVERYMYFALPPFCALLAAGLLALPGRWTGTFAALGVLLFAGRSMMLHRPFVEAVSLDRALRSIEPDLRPGDLVVCADSHSLLMMEHRHPAIETRLLMTWPRLPYYEGATLIVDSLRTTPFAFAEAAASGRRWWGLRVRHGGISSARGAELLDALAQGGREQIDMVTTWAGRPGMRGGRAP